MDHRSGNDKKAQEAAEARRVGLSRMTDMLLNAKKAVRFMGNLGFDAYVANEEKRAAVERVLINVGEAVKKVPDDLCEKYHAIPWSSNAKLRDRISHGYGRAP